MTTSVRGKRLVVALAFLTLSAGSLCVIAARSWLLESWYIPRLRSPDESTRLHAAERLGEMKSLRAAPHLIHAIEAEAREAARFTPDSEDVCVSLTPLLFALYSIGPAALPCLRNALEDEPGLDPLLSPVWTAWTSHTTWDAPVPVERVSYTRAAFPR